MTLTDSKLVNSQIVRAICGFELFPVMGFQDVFHSHLLQLPDGIPMDTEKGCYGSSRHLIFHQLENPRNASLSQIHSRSLKRVGFAECAATLLATISVLMNFVNSRAPRNIRYIGQSDLAYSVTDDMNTEIRTDYVRCLLSAVEFEYVLSISYFSELLQKYC